MKNSLLTAGAAFLLLILITGCTGTDRFDVIIRNGMIYDGSGSLPYKGDVAIRSDTIVAVGNLGKARAEREIDATGLAVAPGFINMLSWAVESLIEDGKSQSDIRQGVTLEILGEGESWGPWNDDMKELFKAKQGDVKYDIEWTTLGEYLEFLERKGVSTNIASFVGTETLRIYAVGYEDREATPDEMETMRMLVRQAMEEGAVGVSAALEYVPAAFASTQELIELCREAAKYDGMYITHLRNEGDYLLESLNEMLQIAREAGIRSEVYHFKQVGQSNWWKLDEAIRKIDSARTAGLYITADMYNYIASSTGFDILMPDWVQEGGLSEYIKRLKDPKVRRLLAPEIKKTIAAKTGTADKIIIIGFNNDSLKYLTGKTLAEVAAIREKSPEETVMDLIIDDGIRVGAVYFSMSEDNVKRQMALPWMAFGSDGQSNAPEGVFLKSSTHPRAYGNFARLLGKYVRDEQVIPLEEAIYKLTTYPAENLRITRRGALKTGYFADLAIFDPGTIKDNATFENPRQYATGMIHVFVNGVQVLKDGEHTGAMPGRVVRGPGWIQE